MFTVILTVVALADYLIIVYCILNMVAKTTVRTEETPKGISWEEREQTMNSAVMGHINNDEEFNRQIEEQNSRIALLSFNVDKILSNIDSIIERDKVKRRVFTG